METIQEALIIANYKYTDPYIGQLTAPLRDAADLAKVLKDPNIGEFKVRELIDKPNNDIQIAVEDFFNDRKREDLLLLYFSGHGIKDETGQLYLASPNTNRKSLRSTAISSRFIFDVLKTCRSNRVVMVLDCCYAGAFPRGKASKGDKRVEARSLLGGKGRVALTASDEMEYSFEGDEIIGAGKQSIFTRALIQGLQSGEADLDGDGYVYVGDLYEYARDKIRNEKPEMTPGIWYDEGYEDILIAKSPSGSPGPSIDSRPRMRICQNPKCSSILRPGAMFCHSCGIKTILRRGEQRCTACGNPRRIGARFCPKCGGEL